MPALMALTMVLCAACGGGGVGGDATVAEQCPVGPACGGTVSGDTIPGGSSTGSTTGKTSGGGSSGGSSGGGVAIGNGTSSAAQLAAKLGRANRLQIGWGDGDPSDSQSSTPRPDIYDTYLSDNPGSTWVDYNSPPGAFIDIRVAQAEQFGAVPMFTIYQMAVSGEANLDTLKSRSLMQTYWAHTVLAFQHFAAYGKPVLVNLEPDFWGFTQQRASGNDPTKIFAYVNITPACASLPNNVAGVGYCMIAIARSYAPNAYVGFPPSVWAGPDAQIIAYMNAVGAATADFLVMQTLDRDAGCFESPSTVCDRGSSAVGVYWDESNLTHPNFADHLAQTSTWQQGIGKLPVIWWQTPMGVPSSAPGGTPGHFRDNRAHYFLTHPNELAAIGGLAVVFGAGEGNQTTFLTDGGQLKNLTEAYFAQPASLP